LPAAVLEAYSPLGGWGARLQLGETRIHTLLESASIGNALPGCTLVQTHFRFFILLRAMRTCETHFLCSAPGSQEALSTGFLLPNACARTSLSSGASWRTPRARAAFSRVKTEVNPLNPLDWIYWIQLPCVSKCGPRMRCSAFEKQRCDLTFRTQAF
jgi:hypothetical protein